MTVPAQTRDSFMTRTASVILCFLLATGCGLTAPDGSDGDCAEGFERDDEGRCTASGGGGADDEDFNDEELDDDAPPDNECVDSDDCTLEMCPPESVQCVCLPVDDICVPGCDTDADCPDIDGEPLLCDDDGPPPLPLPPVACGAAAAAAAGTTNSPRERARPSP